MPRQLGEQDSLQEVQSQLGKGAAPQRGAQNCLIRPIEKHDQHVHPCKTFLEPHLQQAAAPQLPVPRHQNSGNDGT